MKKPSLLLHFCVSLLVLSTGATYAVQPEVVYEFQTGPANPAAGLVQGLDGFFYGTTCYGGHGYGTVFKVDTNGNWTMLFAFDGTNGFGPTAALTLAPDGSFYGTTPFSRRLDNMGQSRNGTLFRLSTNGALTTLAYFQDPPASEPSRTFDNTNGCIPRGAMIWGPDGCLYGTTEYGGPFIDTLWYDGPSEAGTVFKATTNGVLTNEFGFTVTNGYEPRAGLVLGSDGSFYGTVSISNEYTFLTNRFPRPLPPDFGGVFRFDTNGLSILGGFNKTNGGNPFTSLVFGSDGDLYGTTPIGGPGKNASGTIFRIATNGFLTNIATFYKTNGANPSSSLTLGPDGAFYGVTSQGGPYSLGTVFRVTTNGTLKMIAAFSDLNGAHPMADLTLGSDGKLYGTTYDGGVNNSGTVFNIDTNGVLTTLTSFGAPDGTQPMAGLTVGTDGALYGSTFQGGTNGNGTVFRVTTAGQFNTLQSFNGSNGAEPAGSLTLAPDGNLYGTTFAGGASNAGTVFQFSTNGGITSLAFFNNTNGAQPESALVAGPDGQLYGTTGSGGTNLSSGKRINGTIFAISTNGALTSLFSFNNTNGAAPDGGLTLGTNGVFYGTTAQGGAHGFGTIFDITANGGFTSLFAFNHTNGAAPEGPLLLGPDGNFYGTTAQGGSNVFQGNTNWLWNSGTVFEVTPAGQFTSLASLDATNGVEPEAGLVMGPDNRLYATTSEGTDQRSLFPGQGNTPLNLWMQASYGHLTAMTTNGAPTLVASFNGTNGANSFSPLVLAPDGNFYGTTILGGAANAGVIFRLGNPPYISAQPAGAVNLATGLATFTVSARGGLPLSYQWWRNGIPLSDGGVISGSETPNLALAQFFTNGLGQYSIVISNNYGAITSSIAAVTPAPTGGSLILNWQSSGPPESATNTIAFFGLAQASYTVQFATNVTGPWFDLETDAADSNGVGTVIDASATNAQRFYRIRQN